MNVHEYVWLKKILIMLTIAGSGSEGVNSGIKRENKEKGPFRFAWKRLTQNSLAGKASTATQRAKTNKQNKAPCSVCLEATHLEC